MKDLSLFVLGKNETVRNDKNIEIIYTNGKNIIDRIKDASGKYIAFIKDDDKIDKDYLKKVLEKTKEDFDCCFINYDVEYKYKNTMKISMNERELNKKKPHFGEYIWSFIYKKEKLLTVLENKSKNFFNSSVDNNFKNCTSIRNLIYFHNPSGKSFIDLKQLTDIKKEEQYKNIIYVGEGCNGTFNGYISWIRNIGLCFSKKYEIVVLYDAITEHTLKRFSKFFKCIKREDDTNYICDRLLVTYSTYFYPKNIFALEKNYLFIHGNMSDYKDSARYKDDIYTNYVAVSKIAAKKAKGYFPTNKIEYVLNPYKLDKTLMKPHLRLVSAFRYSDIKRPERVVQIAKILTELDIPYTWNLFTDKYENTNMDGLIYRKRVQNPLPYIADSDYLVLLSDSESMSYCVLEALSVNTKVIVTPLEAFKELDVKNRKNGYIIPFDYFKEENKEKLVKLIKEIYKNKDKKINYKFDKKKFDYYNKIFK